MIFLLQSLHSQTESEPWVGTLVWALTGCVTLELTSQGLGFLFANEDGCEVLMNLCAKQRTLPSTWYTLKVVFILLVFKEDSNMN